MLRTLLLTCCWDKPILFEQLMGIILDILTTIKLGIIYGGYIVVYVIRHFFLTFIHALKFKGIRVYLLYSFKLNNNPESNKHPIFL